MNFTIKKYFFMWGKKSPVWREDMVEGVPALWTHKNLLSIFSIIRMKTDLLHPPNERGQQDWRWGCLHPLLCLLWRERSGDPIFVSSHRAEDVGRFWSGGALNSLFYCCCVCGGNRRASNASPTWPWVSWEWPLETPAFCEPNSKNHTTVLLSFGHNQVVG